MNLKVNTFKYKSFESIFDLLLEEAKMKEHYYNQYECEKSIMFQFALMGIDKENIDLQIKDGQLVLKTTPTNKELELTEKYNLKYVSFRTESNLEIETKIKISNKFDVDNVKSELKNGILFVEIFKKPEHLITKKITIN